MTMLAAFCASLLLTDAALYWLYAGTGPALLWLGATGLVLYRGHLEAVRA